MAAQERADSQQRVQVQARQPLLVHMIRVCTEAAAAEVSMGRERVLWSDQRNTLCKSAQSAAIAKAVAERELLATQKRLDSLCQELVASNTQAQQAQESLEDRLSTAEWEVQILCGDLADCRSQAQRAAERAQQEADEKLQELRSAATQLAQAQPVTLFFKVRLAIHSCQAPAMAASHVVEQRGASVGLASTCQSSPKAHQHLSTPGLPAFCVHHLHGSSSH